MVVPTFFGSSGLLQLLDVLDATASWVLARSFDLFIKEEGRGGRGVGRREVTYIQCWRAVMVVAVMRGMLRHWLSTKVW